MKQKKVMQHKNEKPYDRSAETSSDHENYDASAAIEKILNDYNKKLQTENRLVSEKLYYLMSKKREYTYVAIGFSAARGFFPIVKITNLTFQKCSFNYKSISFSEIEFNEFFKCESQIQELLNMKQVENKCPSCSSDITNQNLEKSKEITCSTLPDLRIEVDVKKHVIKIEYQNQKLILDRKTFKKLCEIKDVMSSYFEHLKTLNFPDVLNKWFENIPRKLNSNEICEYLKTQALQCDDPFLLPSTHILLEVLAYNKEELLEKYYLLSSLFL